MIQILGILFAIISAVVEGEQNVQFVDSPVLSSVDVMYDCAFENLWTEERHPRKYPQNAVHWTRQLLASHDSEYSVWKEGSLASTGVEKMAESGGTAELVRELEKNANSYEVGYAKYLPSRSMTTRTDSKSTMRFNNPVSMTSENHYVSVIGKMAPSPDWFSGFHDFDALNGDTQTWYKEFTIETYPYDAGTENGDTYITGNFATIPLQPISRFTTGGVFTNQEGTDILPVAKYTCTLRDLHSSTTGITTKNSNLPSKLDVRYNCMFENQWTKSRHPHEFPVNSLAFRWTKQILTSHDIKYTMWREGSFATKGVETLAEGGGIGDIIKELQDRGDSHDIGYDKYLHSKDPCVYFEPLDMTKKHCYISAISKLSPSPDWFSGFHDFNAVNETSDTWYEEFEIPLYPFDAGTMIGNSYVTFPFPTKSPQPIKQFTVDNVPQSGIFLNEEKNNILPVGKYICKITRRKTFNSMLGINIWIIIAIGIVGTAFVFFSP